MILKPSFSLSPSSLSTLPPPPPPPPQTLCRHCRGQRRSHRLRLAADLRDLLQNLLSTASKPSPTNAPLPNLWSEIWSSVAASVVNESPSRRRKSDRRRSPTEIVIIIKHNGDHYQHRLLSPHSDFCDRLRRGLRPLARPRLLQRRSDGRMGLPCERSDRDRGASFGLGDGDLVRRNG
ncbi:unnamed protein product [Camellia sinensis]